MALIPDLSNKDHTALAATHGLEVQGLEHEKTLMGLIDEDCFQDGLNTSLAKAKEALDSGAGDDRYNSIHNKYQLIPVYTTAREDEVDLGALKKELHRHLRALVEDMGHWGCHGIESNHEKENEKEKEKKKGFAGMTSEGMFIKGVKDVVDKVEKLELAGVGDGDGDGNDFGLKKEEKGRGGKGDVGRAWGTKRINLDLHNKTRHELATLVEQIRLDSKQVLEVKGLLSAFIRMPRGFIGSEIGKHGSYE
ncbi:MAG: hypothetical protein LQ343_005695 [Gyalolechia ehrenbergii]|nr:MAG: hypothetical protein LQ343_005695 [Gyalolechia ehrenbergii]